MCVQDTHAEAWGEDWLEDVVQVAIQAPWGPGLTCGARGGAVSPPGAWAPYIPIPSCSANLSVPTPSLTCAAPARECRGWTWRGTWVQ